MTKTQTAAGGVVVFVGLAIAGMIALPSARAPHEHLSVTLPAVHWPEGKRAVYRIEYRSRDRVVPVAMLSGGVAAASAVETELSLDAVLTVTDRGAAPDGTGQRVEFSLQQCDRAEFSVQEQVAWPDAAACDAAMVGESLVASVTPAGRIAAFYDAPGTNAVAASVLQYLVMALQVDLTRDSVSYGASWNTSESTLLGTAAAAYTLRDFDDRHFRIARIQTGYEELRMAQGMAAPTTVVDGAHQLVLSGGGLIESLTGHGSLTAHLPGQGEILASESRIGLLLLRVEQASRSRTPLGRLIARNPVEARTGSVADAQILDSRINGLTRKQVLDNFATYGNDGAFPDHDRFLWRVTGYLSRYPEHARDLLPLYRRAEATGRLRALLLDVLASTGHAEAQQVMLEALAEDRALDNRASRRLYQRLGFLERPTSATADAVAADYGRWRGAAGPHALDARLATAYSLGAVAGKLGPEDAAAAADYRGWLVDDLLAATDDRVVAHYVTALGNAGGDHLADVLTPLATHDSAEVRGATARALGHAPSPQGRTLLMGLVGDEDSLVQRAALRSLPGVMNDGVLGRLAQEAAGGRIGRLNQRQLLTVLERQSRTNPEATASVLRGLLTSGVSDSELRQVARRMLRRVGGQGS